MGNCPVGNCLGEKLSGWENFAVGKCLVGNCHVRNCPVGNCRVRNCRGEILSGGKMS